MDTKAIERDLHGRYLKALNMYRFIKQDAFQRAWKVALDSERQEAKKLIDTGSHLEAIQWVRTILEKYKEYDYLDVQFLRDLAQERGLRGYSGMTRHELLGLLNGKVHS